MADATVNIIIKATDKASGAISKIMGALDNKHIQSAVKGMAGLSVGIGLVGTALSKTVMDTKAFDLAMGDLAKVWNTTTEEASKMVAVADDARISQEQLAAAMRIAMKQGIEPTIQGLKDAAEKYQSFTNVQEKAEWASKNFGRSWTEVARLLEMTPEQIDDSVDAAERFGNVIGDKDVKAAQALHDNLDNLGDAWEGLKKTIGNGVIPIVVKVSTEMVKQVDLSFRMEAAQDGLKKAYERGQISMKQRLVLLNNMRWSDEAIIAVEDELVMLQDSYNQTLEKYNGALYSTPSNIHAMASAMDAVSTATEIAAAKQAELNSQMDILQLAVSGPLQSETESYTEKVDTLNAKYAETSAKIDELNTKKYLTDAQKTELGNLQGELDTISGDIKKTADAHDEATKRILFNILTQRAQMDGLSQDEFTVLNNIAYNWGLVDTATYNYTMNADKELQDLANGQGIMETQYALEDIKTLTETIPGNYEVNFNVTTTYTNPLPANPKAPSGKRGRALGGPVLAGQSYLVGERGPEMFVPMQNGRIIPNVTNNYGANNNAEVIAAIRNNRLDEARLARLMRDQFAKVAG
jgi:hypothetical protein